MCDRTAIPVHFCLVPGAARGAAGAAVVPERQCGGGLCPLFWPAGTALRAVLNRPRPYEALGFDPLFPKDTKGKSMPSRHCFSAAAIAVTACSVSVPLGVLLWVLAVGIALTRVLTGVHYPSDVLAGLAFGGIAAVLGLALPVF